MQPPSPQHGRLKMKTRSEMNAELDRGSYGSGIGTYVIYLALAAAITLVIQWVC